MLRVWCWHLHRRTSHAYYLRIGVFTSSPPKKSFAPHLSLGLFVRDVSLSIFFSHLNKLLNIFGHSHSLTRKKRIGINYPTLQTFQEQSSGPKAALSFCFPPSRLFEIPQKTQMICNVYISMRPLKLSHSKGITHFNIKLESFAFRDVFSPVVTIFCIWTRGRSSSSSPLMQQTPQTRTIICCSCRTYSLPAHSPRWEKRTEIDY